MQEPNTEKNPTVITRGDFIRYFILAAAGFATSACTRNIPNSTPQNENEYVAEPESIQLMNEEDFLNAYRTIYLDENLVYEMTPDLEEFLYSTSFHAAKYFLELGGAQNYNIDVEAKALEIASKLRFTNSQGAAATDTNGVMTIPTQMHNYYQKQVKQHLMSTVVHETFHATHLLVSSETDSNYVLPNEVNLDEIPTAIAGFSTHLTVDLNFPRINVFDFTDSNNSDPLSIAEEFSASLAELDFLSMIHNRLSIPIENGTHLTIPHGYDLFDKQINLLVTDAGKSSISAIFEDSFNFGNIGKRHLLSERYVFYIDIGSSVLKESNINPSVEGPKYEQEHLATIGVITFAYFALKFHKDFDSEFYDDLISQSELPDTQGDKLQLISVLRRIDNLLTSN